MKVRKMILHNDGMGDFIRKGGDICTKPAFCEDKVREFFDIPADTDEIAVVMYQRPSKNRVKIEESDCADRLLVDGELVHFYSQAYDKLLEWARNGFQYLSLEYRS